MCFGRGLWTAKRWYSVWDYVFGNQTSSARICKRTEPESKQKQEYGQVNKEKIAKQKKKYREKNEEIIKERKNKKNTCECGGKYTNSHKSIHLKTIKHTDWYMEQVD